MSRYRRDTSKHTYTLSWNTYLRSLLSRRKLGVLALVFVCVYLLNYSLSIGTGPGDHPADDLKHMEQGINSKNLENAHKDKEERETSNLAETKKEFEARKALYEEHCKNRHPGRVGPLFIHPPSALTVCHIPKNGCTFWKRVFRFLYRDFAWKKDVKSMFDLDRFLVHFGPSTTFKIYDYRKDGKQLSENTVKVMFTRDPYQRLWSGYVDKFLLPDSWGDHGKAILYSRKGRNSLCPDDIQFEEFLAYTMRNRDEHWRPVFEVCDPCAFKPDIVGHMETFSRDVDYVLTDRGLTYLTQGHNHSNHVEDEMRIMIDYHYSLYKERYTIRNCLTIGQIAARLWRVFQLNGYIRMDDPYPSDEVEETVQDMDLFHAKEAIIKIFTRRFRENPTTKTDWKRTRNMVLQQAYRNVSKEMKQKLRDRFRGDFDLFGYDPTPPGD